MFGPRTVCCSVFSWSFIKKMVGKYWKNYWQFDEVQTAMIVLLSNFFLQSKYYVDIFNFQQSFVCVRVWFWFIVHEFKWFNELRHHDVWNFGAVMPWIWIVHKVNNNLRRFAQWFLVEIIIGFCCIFFNDYIIWWILLNVRYLDPLFQILMKQLMIISNKWLFKSLI